MEKKYSRKREMEEALENESLLFENQKIIDVNMEHEVRKSFIEYSMSVIMARALPDVRDGLKPGQRRVLYAMYEEHLTHDHQPLKSATTVGNVLGRYHPHGDSSVYGTMVHMAQPFNMRYILVEGTGNFGSIDGDPPAAYRYTEARMSKISDEMLRDIDKDAVLMVPNFDNRLKEPSVLPARFPNLLVNGSMGIAVGMATNIPTHNLSEVIDATVYRMDHPDCSADELMNFVKGPDFPTAGIIYGTAGIKQAYKTGKGRITVRARAEVEEEKRRIVITEIPYAVNKAQLVEAMAGLVKNKRIEGITDIRDESDKKGLRIVVDYKTSANGHVILNQLYRYSQLQDTCAVNMLALVNNEPKILTLSRILDHYIAHQVDVVTRRITFDLNAALREAHLFAGYRLAVDNIDEVISIIRASADVGEAKRNLMERFSGPESVVSADGEFDLRAFALSDEPGLSEDQASAIVAMTLGRLSGLERQKIMDRLAQLTDSIRDLRDILGNGERMRAIIKDELQDISKRYGDPRRTEIVEVENEIIDEDLVEKQDCVVTMSGGGYIKRMAADTYSVQNRGGKGITGMTAKEEDFIERIVSVHSHSTVMMFTDTGRVMTMRGFAIPEASRAAKGTHISNLLELAEGERVTAMIATDSFKDDEYLIMITRRGVIKRTPLSEFAYQRKIGKRAIILDEGDTLLSVLHTYGDGEILIASARGLAVRFSESNVRVMGRSAHGVKAMSIGEDDAIVGAVAVDEAKTVMTVTDNGFAKRCDFSDFRTMTNRGGKGVVIQKYNPRTGSIVGLCAVGDDEDVVMMTDRGMVIRIAADDVPVHGRAASGVIVMRTGGEQKVASLAVVKRPEPLPDEKTETGGEDAPVDTAELGEAANPDVLDVPDEFFEGIKNENPDGGDLS